MSDLHPYLSLEYPIRMAHRGSRLLWPENTLTSFQRAVDLGYRYIELDVRATRDRVPVVLHDPTLQRTSNGTGRVADWLWEDLRHLDAAYYFAPDQGFPLRATGIGIPTLEEVFTTWPEVHVNIDVKVSGVEWEVAELIANTRRVDSVLMGAFSERRVARFRRITRGRVATAAGPWTVAVMWAVSRLGRTIKRPVEAYELPHDDRRLSIDRRLIDAVHEAGAHIHLWTVNQPQQMHEYLDMGVDGIVTDRPDLLNEVLSARGSDG